MTWARRGECNHCGWCCQFIARVKITGFATDTPDDVAFLALRRPAPFVDVPGPCIKHDVAAQRCTIYEVRPKACRQFPERPEQIEDTPCSYWFEGVDATGVVIRRGGNADVSVPGMR